MSSTVARWDDLCAKTVIVGMLHRYVVLLVPVKPVKRETSPWRVVGPPTGFITNTCRNAGLLLQPIMQRCGGELALVPLGHQGEEREGAA